MKTAKSEILSLKIMLINNIGIQTESYAEISYLININSKKNDSESVYLLCCLNLLMAILSLEKESMEIFEKYYANALIHYKKTEHDLEDILKNLSIHTSQKSDPIKLNLLSKNEMDLILILKDKKLDRSSLIEKMYGANTDYFVAENRLKNLMFRIRKKYPKIIFFEDGNFQLSSMVK